MTAGHLDLVTLQQLAEELGFRCTRSTSEGLVVDVAGDALLCFVNLPNGDALIGFEGTAWHMHPPFTFFGTGEFIEHDGTTLLAALADGHAPDGRIAVVRDRHRPLAHARAGGA